MNPRIARYIQLKAIPHSITIAKMNPMKGTKTAMRLTTFNLVNVLLARGTEEVSGDLDPSVVLSVIVNVFEVKLGVNST